jgi:hypothetical protein
MPNGKRTPLIVIALVAVVALVAAIAFAVTNDGDSKKKKEPTPVAFKEFNLAGPTQVRSLDSPLWNTTQQLVFRSLSDWTNQDLPQDSLRSVDFAQQNIVAVSMGQRPTGGYTIAVTAIHEDGEKIVVDVTQKAPGAGCGTTQALTKPLQFVEMPPSALPVEFVVKDETTTC